jgi:hypothetical protein
MQLADFVSKFACGAHFCIYKKNCNHKIIHILIFTCRWVVGTEVQKELSLPG